MLTLLLILLAGVWAGAQNALAGGGSFVTLPTLILSGLDARAANLTSTVALFPGQVVTGWMGRDGAGGAGGLSLRALAIISLVGGVLGAGLLLLTPPTFFARFVPWLVLFATGVFTWGSFFRRTPPPGEARHLGKLGAGFGQFAVATYGGYFGGGGGFIMMAVLSLAGQKARMAASTKNLLSAVFNASATLFFCLSGHVAWKQGVVLCVGAMAGGVLGAWALKRVPDKALRIVVVAIGAVLTVGLFLRGA